MIWKGLWADADEPLVVVDLSENGNWTESEAEVWLPVVVTLVEDIFSAELVAFTWDLSVSGAGDKLSMGEACWCTCDGEATTLMAGVAEADCSTETFDAEFGEGDKTVVLFAWCESLMNNTQMVNKQQLII